MEYLNKIRSNESFRLWANMFGSGVFPGAVAGSVVGLAPGVLLILVLTGDTYYIKASEVLGFVVMSVAFGAILGSALGGVCTAVGSAVLRKFRRS